MQNKNPVFDIVKGIAIILVVYGHVIQRSMAGSAISLPGAEAVFYLNPAFKLIYTFYMPVFFFISGFLMSMSLKKRSIEGVFKSRLRSLLVPLCSWGILGLIASYCLTHHFDPSIWLVWFLYTLFVLSCVLLFSVKLAERFGSISFTIVYLLLLFLPFNDLCYLYFIKWFYLFYLAGYLLQQVDFIKIKSSLKIAALFLAIVMFVILLPHWSKEDYIYVNQMSGVSIHEIYRTILRYVLGFSGILILFFIGSYLTKNKQADFLRIVGVYSLDIYLIQRYILEGLFPRILTFMHVHFDSNSNMFLFLFAPLIVVVYVVSCMFISYHLIRSNAWLNKILLGGRA